MTKKIAPDPPRRSRFAIQAPPPPDEAPNNMASGASPEVLQDMNFKVRPSFHNDFKVEAVMRKMSMKDFLEACFLCYIEKHGSALMNGDRKVIIIERPAKKTVKPKKSKKSRGRPEDAEPLEAAPADDGEDVSGVE